MAELPFMPFDTGAYVSDTLHLTPAQHGAYLKMIIVAWRSPDCKLPSDDAYLARITGLGMRAWGNNRDVLLAFWRVDDDGKLYQPRMVERYKFASHKREVSVQAGRASALKRNKSPSTPVDIPLERSFNQEKKRKKEKDIITEDKSSSITSLSLSRDAEVGEREKSFIDLDLMKGKRVSLPDGATLKHDWGKWAESRGMDSQTIIARWEAFKNHHLSEGTKSACWQSAWKNWINKFLEIKKEKRA